MSRRYNVTTLLGLKYKYQNFPAHIEMPNFEEQYEHGLFTSSTMSNAWFLDTYLSAAVLFSQRAPSDSVPSASLDRSTWGGKETGPVQSSKATKKDKETKKEKQKDKPSTKTEHSKVRKWKSQEARNKGKQPKSPKSKSSTSPASAAASEPKDFTKSLQTLLNKITTGNAERLVQNLLNSFIITSSMLKESIRAIHHKAIREGASYTSAYVTALQSLADDVRYRSDEEEEDFEKLILSRNNSEINFEGTGEERESAFSPTRSQLNRGGYRFLAELYVQCSVDSEAVMELILSLINVDSGKKLRLECLQAFMQVAGSKFELEADLDDIFNRIEEFSKDESLPPRHRFMCMDLLDLRKSNYKNSQAVFDMPCGTFSSSTPEPKISTRKVTKSKTPRKKSKRKSSDKLPPKTPSPKKVRWESDRPLVARLQWGSKAKKAALRAARPWAKLRLQYKGPTQTELAMLEEIKTACECLDKATPFLELSKKFPNARAVICQHVIERAKANFENVAHVEEIIRVLLRDGGLKSSEVIHAARSFKGTELFQKVMDVIYPQERPTLADLKESFSALDSR